MPGWGDDVNLTRYLRVVASYLLEQRIKDYERMDGECQAVMLAALQQACHCCVRRSPLCCWPGANSCCLQQKCELGRSSINRDISRRCWKLWIEKLMFGGKAGQSQIKKAWLAQRLVSGASLVSSGRLKITAGKHMACISGRTKV